MKAGRKSLGNSGGHTWEWVNLGRPGCFCTLKVRVEATRNSISSSRAGCAFSLRKAFQEYLVPYHSAGSYIHFCFFHKFICLPLSLHHDSP